VNLDVKQYERKPFHVLAVQVTTENISDVALWCDGKVLQDVKEGDATPIPFIKVDVRRPLHERQTRAYVGDWVLRAGQGFRVYNDGAFLKSFDESVGFDVESPKQPIIPEQTQRGVSAISPADLALLAKAKQDLENVNEA
jgi:hypothetical protein